MPLPYISIDNFRAFKEKCEFEFAPITILTGTNSSGKSSLVDAVRVLKNYFNEVGKNREYDIYPENFWKDLMTLKVDVPNSRITDFELLHNNKTTKKNILFEFKRRMKGIGNVTLMFEFRKSDNGNGNGKLNSFKILNDDFEVFFELNNEINTFIIKINYKYLLSKFEEVIENEITFFNAYFENDLNDNVKENHRGLYKYSILESEYEGHSDFWEQSHDEEFIIPILFSHFKNNPDARNEYLKFKKNFEKTKPFYNYDIRDNEQLNQNLYTLSEKIGISEIALPIVEKEFFRDVLTFEIANSDTNECYRAIDTIIKDALRAYYQPQLSLSNIQVKIVSSKPELVDFYTRIFSADSYRIDTLDENDYQKEFIFREKKAVVSPSLKRSSIIGKEEYSEINNPDVGSLFFNDFIYDNIITAVTSLNHNFKFEFFNNANTINTQQRSYLLNKHTGFEKILSDCISKNTYKDAYSTPFLNKYIKLFTNADKIVIAKQKDSGTHTIYLVTNEIQTNLSDYGFGVSKLLPILLSICNEAVDRIDDLEDRDDVPYNTDDRKLFIIEEPETNLHPALQSKLADMFVEASKLFHIQFIIETHSEYLIRRLQGMVVKKETEADNIKIYYFNHPDKIPEGEQQVYAIEIEKDGGLSRKFGEGFLDEAANLNIALYNYTKEQHN